MASTYTLLRREYLKTWRIWYVMNQRCDPEWRSKHLRNDRSYYAICDEWSREVSGEQGFLNFFDCVGDLELVEDLHRKDTNLPYAPNNIIKGDIYTRVRRSKTFNSETAHWYRHATSLGLPKWVYYLRLKQGMPPKQAATEPYQRKMP